LLFLTPLKPRHIVYAKGAAHGLRAVTLWLAVLPMMAIPLLAGGVGGFELLMFTLVSWASLCLALAAGILASGVSRVYSRALALAGVLAVFFAVFMGLSFIWVLDVFGFSRPWPGWYPRGGLEVAYLAIANPGGEWQQWLSRRASPWKVVQPYMVVALLSAIVFLIATGLAAWWVRRFWRGEPPSARIQSLQNTLTRPLVFRPVLHRWLQWQLQRNPIGWLEQRSWSSRLVLWSWFAVMACVYSSLLANLAIWQRAFQGMQTVLASLLAVCITVSAAGSFRRERETGVLELLLVAPVQEWDLIKGRLRGLWTQFLPSIVLLCAVWLYCATFLSSQGVVYAVFLYCVAFATLPAIGLYFSLARANFMASLLWTLLVGVAVPAFAGQLTGLWLDSEDSSLAKLAAPIVQISLAVFLAQRLHDKLRHRKFSFQLKGT
jgi:hypothetical protein